MKVHFVGINGSGISGVACIAKNRGFDVDGCDMNAVGDYTQQLLNNGIKIFEGHHESHLKDKDLVVLSPALLFKDKYKKIPELATTKLPVIKWQQFLGDYIIKGQNAVVVAGTHGKTTTTTLIALILEAGRLDPTTMIGGEVKEWDNRSYRVGNSSYFVCEGDEYDENFLHYKPKYLVINNLEMEHSERFKDFNEYLETFKKLLLTMQDNGKIIFNYDNENVLNFLNANGDIIASKNTELVGWTDAKIVDLSRKFENIEINDSNYKENLLDKLKTLVEKPIYNNQIFIALNNYALRHVLNKAYKVRNKERKKLTKKILLNIEDIIIGSKIVDYYDVDLTHNTRKRTLEHKKTLYKYLILKNIIKVNDDFFNVKLTTEICNDNKNKNRAYLVEVNVKKIGGAKNQERPCHTTNMNSILNNKNQNVKLYTIEKQNKTIIINGNKIEFNLLGEHNASNIATASILALELGISFDAINTITKKFSGSKRRMDLIFENERVKIYDDYGHHHTQIKTTIEGLKSDMESNEKLIAILEPHLISRIAQNTEEYKQYMKMADYPIITKIYKSREADLPDPDMIKMLNDPTIEYIEKFDNVVARVKNIRENKKNHKFRILVMGAGYSYKLAKMLVEIVKS